MQISVKRGMLTEVRKWFMDYVSSFQEKQRYIALKRAHTLRVCSEISTLGKKLGLNSDELHLAGIIGMLHDVGRFEQYARYHTFIDGRSENHAELGVAIIKRFGILDNCDDVIRDLTIRCVRYHNRASLPSEESEPCLFFSRLLRDADKLDIWKIVTEYYSQEKKSRNRELELDLPDTSGFSDAACEDLMNSRIVNIAHVKNLNDFKLLQIGWVFDINFQPALDVVRKRRYLEKIGEVLPNSDRIDRIFSIIDHYTLHDR